MTQPASEALELALAVFHAPSRRHALRDRPLPEGVGGLIQLATGSPTLLADAAQVTGETETEVLEAVRFYLQQALFVPDASAYRVLGLAPNASVEQIRDHHRWLQHWLHPDRLSEWEAVFASKVNWAWGELRNAQRRRAYDATLAAAAPLDAGLASPDLAPAPGWNAAPSPVRALSLRSGLLLGVSLASCLLLVTLLVLREHRNSMALEQGTDPAPDATAHGIATEASADADAAEAAVDRGGAPILSALTRMAAAENAAERAILRQAPAPPAEPTGTERITPAVAAIPIPIATTRPIVPGPEPAQTRDGNRVSSDKTKNVPTQAPARIVADAMPVQPARNPDPPRRPDAGSDLPANVVAAQPRSPVVVSDAPKAAIAPVVTVEVPPVARVKLAHQRFDQITTFLANPAARTPPIWDDVQAQQQAELVRAALQADAVAGAPAFADPRWRIGPEHARVSGAWHIGDRNGQLFIELRWRQNMWLVESLTSELAQ